MTQINISINMSLKKIIFTTIIFGGILLLLQGNKIWAQSQSSGTTLSGTYGCMQNRNFQGFLTRLNGGSGTYISALYTITFSNGTMSINGVQNKVNNFEQNNASMTQSNFTNINTFTFQENTPTTGMVKVTNTLDNSVSYGLAVNGGNTLFTMASPTDKPSDFAVCQKI